MGKHIYATDKMYVMLQLVTLKYSQLFQDFSCKTHVIVADCCQS